MVAASFTDAQSTLFWAAVLGPDVQNNIWTASWEVKKNDMEEFKDALIHNTTSDASRDIQYFYVLFKNHIWFVCPFLSRIYIPMLYIQ